MRARLTHDARQARAWPGGPATQEAVASPSRRRDGGAGGGRCARGGLRAGTRRPTGGVQHSQRRSGAFGVAARARALRSRRAFETLEAVARLTRCGPLLLACRAQERPHYSAAAATLVSRDVPVTVVLLAVCHAPRTLLPELHPRASPQVAPPPRVAPGASASDDDPDVWDPPPAPAARARVSASRPAARVRLCATPAPLWPSLTLNMPTQQPAPEEEMPSWARRGRGDAGGDAARATTSAAASSARRDGRPAQGLNRGSVPASTYARPSAVAKVRHDDILCMRLALSMRRRSTRVVL